MTEFDQRISRLQEVMRQKRIHGFLLTQNVDLYYFTGCMQNGYLYVSSEGDAIFYVRRSINRARAESYCMVKEIGSFRSFEDTLRKDFPELIDLDPIVVATEYDVMPVQLLLKLQSVLPSVQFIDGSILLRELRMIKSEFEVSAIKQAAKIVDQAFHESLNHLQEGMTEIAYMQVIENELRKRGHLGVMRMRGYNQEIITGMVAAGAAAAMPTYFDGPAGGIGLHPAAPQGSSMSIIEKHSPILVDIGCCMDGYVIDQTRMACIGNLPDQLQDAYDLSVEILSGTETLLRPGVICEDIYMQALRFVEEKGLTDHFMGFKEDRVSFLGHGIGLEIDEWPVLAKGFKFPLQSGMVIAIEPKFSFPGMGVVGIEDTYLITDDGFERLTVTNQQVFHLNE